MWSVAGAADHIVSLSCHVHIRWEGPERHDHTVKSIAEMLRREFQIVRSTIPVCYDGPCEQTRPDGDSHQHPDHHRESGHGCA
jgi:hypothetical protein